jgi:serine/threonine-protein kinase
MSQTIGTVLDGKYELIRLLGEGGMGSVYEAQHRLIGRRLAVKFLHPQYASSPDVVTRFQREAQAAAQIGHENIIEVTDMGTSPDQSPYLVMEFLEGCDLKRLIEDEGVLEPKRAAHIMVQALGALQAAHNVGIIHRDLKPENIYLIQKGGNPDYVKLLDFGISKFRALETDGVKGLTQTGTVLGTPHYMSPEQARGEQDLSPRSDIYAMGVILYQMLTGHLPFDAPNYNALLIKILTEQPPAPESLNPELPADLVDTINIAMARDASARFETCTDFRRRLLPFAPGASGLGVPLTTASRTAIREALYSTKTPFEMTQSGIDKKKSRTPLMIGAAAAILLIGVGVTAAVVLTGGDGGKDPANAPVAAAGADVVEPSAAAPLPDATVAPTAEPEEGAAVPPAVATINLKITATPAEAVIRIDGAGVGSNPFDGPFAKGGLLRTIEISAPGYEPIKELVKFDEDRTLAYDLQKAEARKGVKVVKKQGDPEQDGKPAAAAEVKPKGSGGKKPSRNIDYGDPWKQ